jgi:hypothetical protein
MTSNAIGMAFFSTHKALHSVLEITPVQCAPLRLRDTWRGFQLLWSKMI